MLGRIPVGYVTAKYERDCTQESEPEHARPNLCCCDWNIKRTRGQVSHGLDRRTVKASELLPTSPQQRSRAVAQPTFETLLYDVADGIATITLNRPDKLNAFNTQMMKDMIAAFDATDADDAVRAVIVTGAGRGFCAGADLSAGGSTFDYDARGGEDRAARMKDGVPRDGGGLLTLRIFDSLKPVISACNGPAVGVGVTMQCAMDIRL